MVTKLKILRFKSLNMCKRVIMTLKVSCGVLTTPTFYSITRNEQYMGLVQYKQKRLQENKIVTAFIIYLNGSCYQFIFLFCLSFYYLASLCSNIHSLDLVCFFYKMSNYILSFVSIKTNYLLTKYCLLTKFGNI